jgi:flagellar biosynthesis/type III secretory pathway protein FliH
VKLIELLLGKKYEREKIEKIFVFLDTLLNLPIEMELKFEEDWNEKKGRAKEMQLTWENSNLAEAHRKKARQEGKKEGKKEGKQEGKQEDILVLLADYGLISQDLKERIKSETKPETLTKWLKLAAKVTTIEEFVAKMDLN